MNIKNSMIRWNEETNSRNRLLATPGIWMNGKTYWMKNDHEQHFPAAGVSLILEREVVDSKMAQFHVYVTNHNRHDCEIKLLMMHELEKRQRENFSFLSPAEKVIYHLSDNSIYMVDGRCNGGKIEEYTIQCEWNVYNNTFWKNEEKGIFHYQPMAKGSAVSLYSFNLKLKGFETSVSKSWIISGTNKTEMMNLNTKWINSI